MNKFNSQKFTKDSNSSSINKFNIVSSQTLGQNKALYVVEINNQYLVLGATQSNINLLKEFSKSDIDKVNYELKQKQKDTWVDDIAVKYDNFGDNNAKGN